jgi:hypothetical protein
LKKGLTQHALKLAVVEVADYISNMTQSALITFIEPIPFLKVFHNFSHLYQDAT